MYNFVIYLLRTAEIDNFRMIPVPQLMLILSAYLVGQASIRLGK